jgi:hypothetical protein
MHDELNRRLMAAAADVARSVHITTAARVRARGDRRRVGVATSAVGVLAVAAVGVGVLSTGAGGGSNIAEPDRLHGRIPDALTMPHEGEEGWTSNDDAAVRAVFDGCAASDPTQVGRTDARTMTGPGAPVEQQHSPATVTEQLFLYQDEKAAQSAIAALRQGVTTCGWIDPAVGVDPQNGGQLEGTIVHSQQPSLDMERITGFQIGNAVFIVHGRIGGAGMAAPGVNEKPMMAAELCRVMQICELDASGMPSPPPGTGYPQSSSPGPAAT